MTDGSTTSEVPRLYTYGLGKWPRLLVRGEPVTEAQANEILIRTMSLHGHTNDRAWMRQVNDLIGLETDDYGWPEWKSAEAAQGRYRMLTLEYLNNSRVMSSWIGGPHGWCDWDGTIGCSDYNIGKWPAAEDVDQEWRAIAAAFPFLRLEAQLVGDEGEGRVLVAWRIADGKVMLRPRPKPTEYLRPVHEPNMIGLISMLNGGGNHRERGVTPERLEVALAQVRDGGPET